MRAARSRRSCKAYMGRPEKLVSEANPAAGRQRGVGAGRLSVVLYLKCDTMITHGEIMAKTEMVHARIEPQLKKRAEKVFDQLGLTATEAIRLFYRQVELRKGLPFAVQIPNEVTAETLRKADAGEDVHRAENAKDLFKKLGI